MAYKDTILAESSLISYWRLDELSGTTATDAKSGLNGTYNGGFTLNQAPGALLLTKSTLFNGSTGYVVVPTNAVLHPTTSVSLEVWIKPAALPGSPMEVAGCGFSAGGSPYIDYELTVDPSSKAVFQLGTSGTVVTFVTAPTALVIGVWYHLLGTYNGTIACLYVNGVLVASTPLTGAINNSGQTFTIARYQRGAFTGEYFSGNVSDVSVYNTALSAGTVQTHYNASDIYKYTILAESGLVSYWRLDETSGTSAIDIKSGLTGTYTAGFTLNQLPIAGQMSRSTLFDGSTGYVTVPTNAALHPATAVSLEAWIKIPSLPSAYKTIAGCDFTANSTPYVNYLLAMTSANLFRGLLAVGSTLYEIDAGPALAGTLYHLVLTYDGATLKLYVSGLLASSLPVTGAILNSNQTFEIARTKRGATIGEWFSGYISDVAVYNVALSGATVLAHYNVAGGIISARLSQEVVEVLDQGNPNIRLTQEVVEVLDQRIPTSRLSQIISETLRSSAFITSIRSSQTVVEVLSSSQRSGAPGIYAYHMMSQGMM